MSEALEYARRLAAEASGSYPELKAAAESGVVRWAWATSAVRSYRPAYFELAKMKRGRALPSPPARPGGEARAYGLDPQDRVLVERRYTEFPGQFYETFFVHLRDGIACHHFTYSPDKRWIHVEWLVFGEPGIVAAHAVYARGNWLSVSYDYDEVGRVVRCRRQGPNPPYGQVDDVRELEYDATGQIVRVFWRRPDGTRQLDFERPAREATLRACRKALLEELTGAMVTAVRSTRIEGEVYALILSHCEADHQHRVPPHLHLGLVLERSRLVEEHGSSAPAYVWNPAEWSGGELTLGLPAQLASLCDAVNQDIWQNDLQAEADLFLGELALSLRRVELPCRLAAGFVTAVVDLDAGDFASQVFGQIDRRTARALQASRLL